MERYLFTLFTSELPYPIWAAATLWLVLFLINHWAVKLARAANDAQRAIVVEDWSALRKGSEPKYIALQVFIAAILLQLANLLGGAAYVFLAGGLLIAMCFVLALNLQAFLTGRSMAHPDVGTGTFTFSTPAALRQMGQRVVGSAVACLITGLVAAHLAFLGGALILGATASGFFRRARRVKRGG